MEKSTEKLEIIIGDLRFNTDGKVIITYDGNRMREYSPEETKILFLNENSVVNMQIIRKQDK